MRPYLIPIALVCLLCLPTRPFVLVWTVAWTWLRARPLFHAFDELQGRAVALKAAAEKPNPPASN